MENPFGWGDMRGLHHSPSQMANIQDVHDLRCDRLAVIRRVDAVPVDLTQIIASLQFDNGAVGVGSVMCPGGYPRRQHIG